MTDWDKKIKRKAILIVKHFYFLNKGKQNQHFVKKMNIINTLHHEYQCQSKG